MDEEDVSTNEHDSYYAVLGVSRDASLEDVRRSYRQLAQVCHPDKVSDPTAREQAAEDFTRIQQAYEVLGNDEKRVIYDLYGKEGLEAGLELAEVPRNTDELRREYERNRAKQAEERQEVSVAHRGAYIFRVDACDMMNPYDSDVDHLPELISVATTNSVQIPVSESLAASIGCQVAVRKKVGGGSFVCGVKRILTPVDTLEFHAAVGLKMLAQLQVSRQLSSRTSATVAGMWHPQAGLGLVLSSSRQLSPTTAAEWTWQVGPDSVVGLALTRKGEKLLLSCKLETGASLGIVAKAVWQVTASTSLRASAKLGTMGMELELGGSQQVTEFSSAGCSVVTGLQGVVLKPRFSRGGHVFEMPVLLSQSPQDYTVLAVAYILPPALSFAAKYVISKLRKRARALKAIERRQRLVSELQAEIKKARRWHDRVEPIAKRNLRNEIKEAGLVIVSAKFGAPEAVRETEARERLSKLNGDVNAHIVASSQPLDSAQDGRRFTPRPSDDGESSTDEEEAVDAALPEMPPPWLDVTVPLRYMAKNGVLHFAKGVRKSGMMGFCDVSLTDDKVLHINYLWQGNAYSVTFTDKGEGMLPRDGTLLPQDSEEAVYVRRLGHDAEASV